MNIHTGTFKKSTGEYTTEIYIFDVWYDNGPVRVVSETAQLESDSKIAAANKFLDWKKFNIDTQVNNILKELGVNTGSEFNN